MSTAQIELLNVRLDTALGDHIKWLEHWQDKWTKRPEDWRTDDTLAQRIIFQSAYDAWKKEHPEAQVIDRQAAIKRINSEIGKFLTSSARVNEAQRLYDKAHHTRQYKSIDKIIIPHQAIRSGFYENGTGLQLAFATETSSELRYVLMPGNTQLALDDAKWDIKREHNVEVWRYGLPVYRIK